MAKFLRNTVITRKGTTYAGTEIRAEEVAFVTEAGGALVDDSDSFVASIIKLAQEARKKGRPPEIIEQLMLATPNPKVSGGDVIGPGSSTDNAIATFNGTAGTSLNSTTALIDDNGSLNLAVAGGDDEDTVFTANNTGTNGAKASFLSGSRNPEGLVSADPGTFYLRTDGISSTMYQLRSAATANTPWEDVGDSMGEPTTCLMAHTGMVSSGGGLITINGGDNSKFDVSAGSGWIIDQTDPTDPMCKFVQWTAFTAVTVTDLAGSTLTAIGIQATGSGPIFGGVIVQKANVPFDANERRTTLGLGALTHPDMATIGQASSQITQPANNGILSFSDFVREVIGPANANGNVYSANGANLSLDKSSGSSLVLGVEFHFDAAVPDLSSDPALLAPSFFRVLRSAADPDEIITDGASTTFVEPDFFDDGTGTLAAVSNNDFTVQQIYWSPGGNGTGTVIVAYGQETFNTKDEAINALRGGELQFEERPALAGTLLRSFLIVEEGATDLTVLVDAEFIEATAFRIRGLAGSTGGGGGAEAFLDLNDTPGSYVSDASKLLRVNAAETDLEFSTNVTVDDSDNMAGLESLSIDHTATADDDFALRVSANAAGFADVKAVNIAYATGALAAGEGDVATLVSVDETASTGGAAAAFVALSTDEGSAEVIGLAVGATINPVVQRSGTFGDADSILVLAVDQTVALSQGGAGNISIFVANSDTITIGDVAQFSELAFILDTGSSGGGVAPTFEFSTGIGTFASFVPSDGTSGFRQTGVVAWDPADLSSWATGTGGEFLIRVTRTRNTVATTPIVDLVQRAITVTRTWDKDGDLHIRSAQLADRAAPANPGAGLGELYKKTADDGLFWKPDAAGAEVDLTTFLGATDTPSSYAGQARKLVRVNAGETAIEFAEGLFDAVVPDDFLLPSAAFAAGANSVFVKDGTFVETANIVVPNGGRLTGESKNVIFDMSGGAFSVTVNGDARSTKAGTISATNLSTAIVGVGTSFTTMQAGDFILVGNVFMEIASVTDNTNIVLSETWQGETLSGFDTFAFSMFVNVTLDNFCIIGSTTHGLDIDQTLFLLCTNIQMSGNLNGCTINDSGDTIFEACLFENNTGDGCQINDSFHNHFSECHFNNNATNGVDVGGASMTTKLVGCGTDGNGNNGFNTAGTSSDFEIMSGSSSYNDNKGINIAANTERCAIVGTTIEFNGGQGCDFDGTHCAISSCHIGNNGNHGIEGGDIGSITGNHIHDNGSNGINLGTGDDHCTVTGNHIASNNNDGIGLTANNAVISANLIHLNGAWGIDIAAAADNSRIGTNFLMGNTNGPIDDDSTNTKFSADPVGLPVQGEIAYHDGTDWVLLAPGTSGQVLETQGAGADPQWATAAGGGIPLATMQSVTAAGPTAITATNNTHVRVNFAGAATLTLPTGVVGRQIRVVDVSGAASVTNDIVTSGGTINGNDTISAPNASLLFVCASTGPDVWDSV